jgi:hypothetical protein
MTSADAPHVGSVLSGRYELVRHVGTDGVADVYEAEDQLLHRRVAVHLCRAEAPEERARFEAEARTLARVSRPGPDRVLDAGRHDDAAFVVRQLAAGAVEEPTEPIAVVDPSGDVTQVIAGVDATQVFPAAPPLLLDAPVPARSRGVPVWGMVLGLAAALVAVLLFAATRNQETPGQTPAVVESTSTSTTVLAVHTPVRASAPTTTTTTAPTTTEPSTTTTPPAPSTSTIPFPATPGPQGPDFTPPTG